MPGPIDAVVAGYGTGGTLAGVGRAIKQRYPEAKVLADVRIGQPQQGAIGKFYGAYVQRVGLAMF